jgi:hypothetical protein
MFIGGWKAKSEQSRRPQSGICPALGKLLLHLESSRFLAKTTTNTKMTDSPPPEEQKKIDAEAKAKEDAEQAALPYKWTQTIKDVDITISIPANLKGRDLNVKFTKNKLFASIKGQDAFIDVSSLFSL